ncbi:MAG: hypothetical protein WC437_04455 [Patescibacteria group bacterium]
MLKIKNILITIIAIIAIGLEFSVILYYQKFYFLSEVAKIGTSELTSIEMKESPEIKYKIASVGTWQDEIKWARHHVVTEEPLINENWVRMIAEKIIKDILAEDPELKKIELLLYNDKNVACQTEETNARIIWIPDKFSVEIMKK